MLNQCANPKQLMFEPTNCILGVGGLCVSNIELFLSANHPPTW